MDPDICLANIRATIDLYNNADDDDISIHYANEIVDLFEALDAWLSRGGFLPDAWFQA